MIFYKLVRWLVISNYSIQMLVLRNAGFKVTLMSNKHSTVHYKKQETLFPNIKYMSCTA